MYRKERIDRGVCLNSNVVWGRQPRDCNVMMEIRVKLKQIVLCEGEGDGRAFDMGGYMLAAAGDVPYGKGRECLSFEA
ncbi:hypothetical protein EK904_001274 [Melospiza melodia maxima]|nr:hypothetical protein EK904_001274 [Melospiza melodia maxima]